MEEECYFAFVTFGDLLTLSLLVVVCYCVSEREAEGDF